MSDDPFDLERFVEAQASVYPQVVAELTAGRKRSHWMWFVFPQLRGLGHSTMAERYGISGAEEARAYVSHPVLGPRLLECTDLALAIERKSVTDIFDPPDDLKLRSCLTLFESVAPQHPAFALALEKLFGGERDATTVEMLRRMDATPRRPV